ncbi:MAG: carboxylesterase family protein [Polyangiaceae bacterium]|nr:carboxylesterase family protein [Myxococcales bacterium]MCB9587787.1 carboxylesterase family protein [Polyangiaceae bacterium]MCB9608736.1 carboxylesterase family protein [Polyangiaceae bacterium]
MGEFRIYRAAWALVVVACAGCGEDAVDSGDRQVQPGVDVETSTGPIHGEEAGELRIFRGIPYAAPPLSELRFRATTPHAIWSERLDTTQFGPGCPQNGDSVLNPVSETSEDCLTLNIWAHQNAPDDALRPVMVYLHGGGFVSGAGSSPLYESTRVASQGDVVVVTLNYRLGALGFLATDEIRAENGSDSAWNNGLLDQRAALRWIQANIAAFGGDPGNVTLFGQSAGGVSVCAHLAMSESRHLFHKAILQSAGGCSDMRLLEGDPLPPGGTLALAETFIEAANCASESSPVACLRRLPVDELLRAQTEVPANFWGNQALGPSVGGAELSAQPLEQLRQDADVAVPLLTGAMSAEMALFVFGNVVKADTDTDYHDVAVALTGSAEKAAKLESVYPLSQFASAREAVVVMGTEFAYACPAKHLATFMAGRGAPAFNYEMRATVGGLAGAVGPGHGLDVPFVFGTLDASNLLSYDAEDRALSDAMIGFWTEFARSGAPGSEWQAVTQGSYVLEEQNPHMEMDASAGRCQQLEVLGLIGI